MRRHLTLLFDPHDLQIVEDVRQQWDPSMAAIVPAHVTLAYPEEFSDDYERLLKRADQVAKTFESFFISFTDVVCDDEGVGGVFLEVADTTNSWAGLREAILAEPFKTIEVSPHITIVHPRTSNRGPEAWLALNNWKPKGTLQVREISFTETSAHGFKVIKTIALKQPV